MKIPKFVVENRLNKQFTNLMLNCPNKYDFVSNLQNMAIHYNSFDEDELKLCMDQFTKPRDYSVLSPYYFVQSKNDPENELKDLLTYYIP